MLDFSVLVPRATKLTCLRGRYLEVMLRRLLAVSTWMDNSDKVFNINETCFS
jgi:hypothetical protein